MYRTSRYLTLKDDRKRHKPKAEIMVKIIQKGKESGQGVGYLPDGTMIVVESANSDIGTTIDVVVSRVIQTTAGRILFAKKI